MDSLNLERLGQAVAEVSDALHSNEDETRVHAELLRGLDGPAAKSRARSRLTKTALLAATLLGSLTMLLLWIGIGPRALEPISFSEGGAPGEVRTWISPREVPKTLKFSEGSRLRVLPEARARVNTLSPHGAEVLLETGTVDVAIVPHEGAHWLLLVGPFSVRVTGTEFRLTWAPEAEGLLLQMKEGSVIVDGPSLEHPQVVVGQQELRIAASEKPERPASSSASEAAPEVKSATTPQESIRSVSVGDAKTPSRDAHPEVDEVGELLARADAARLAGQGELARQALILAREKHGVRSNTAYLLGKVSADQLNDTSEAARWFETYLREQPTGGLREQALGRLLTMGHGTRAVIVERARVYLELYPEGAYAPLARRLLARPTGL